MLSIPCSSIGKQTWRFRFSPNIATARIIQMTHGKFHPLSIRIPSMNHFKLHPLKLISFKALIIALNAASKPATKAVFRCIYRCKCVWAGVMNESGKLLDFNIRFSKHRMETNKIGTEVVPCVEDRVGGFPFFPCHVSVDLSWLEWMGAGKV